MPVTALPYVPPTCTLVKDAVVHGDGSRVKDARLPSSMPRPLPRTLSACAPSTDSMELGAESHVKEANALTEHAALEPLAVPPAAQFTVHVSELAMLITAVTTTVSMRFACEGGQ